MTATAPAHTFSRPRTRAWIILALLLAGMTLGLALRLGIQAVLRSAPELFGPAGPADLPLAIDSTLSPTGALTTRAPWRSDPFWDLVRADVAARSSTDLCVHVRWEKESVAEAWIWIPLEHPARRQARVAFQRSSLDGQRYGFPGGFGLDGVVRVNRATIPSTDRDPLVIELDLVEYGGGSGCSFRIRVALLPEDFR